MGEIVGDMVDMSALHNDHVQRVSGCCSFSAGRAPVTVLMLARATTRHQHPHR